LYNQSNQSIPFHSVPFHYYSNTQQSIAASQMDTNVALKEDEVIGNFKIKKRLGEGGSLILIYRNIRPFQVVVAWFTKSSTLMGSGMQ
jgi:hypothetical protein